MATPSIEEHCEACERLIPAGQPAFADGQHVLCELCYRSKHASNSKARPANQAPASPQMTLALAGSATIAPRYLILTVAANLIMILALFTGACIFAFGIYVLVRGVGKSLAPPPPNPMFDFSDSIFKISVTSGCGLMLYGLLLPLVPVAFGQLLLAVRDIAINSFHSRHALTRLR